MRCKCSLFYLIRRHKFLCRSLGLRYDLSLAALRTIRFILFDKVVDVPPLAFRWFGDSLWLRLEFLQLIILVFLLFFLQHFFYLFSVKVFSWLCKLKKNVLGEHTLATSISAFFENLFLGRGCSISLNNFLNSWVQDGIDSRSEHSDCCHGLGGWQRDILWNLGNRFWNINVVF